MEAHAHMGQHSDPRAFHHNSNSLADFRSRGTDTSQTFPHQQQHGPPHMQNGPPGLNNAMIGNGVHRRNGTALANGVPTGTSATTGTKNTSHVPCKFFKEGKCQAGRGCQFSHAPEDFQRPAPCKYFSKGNCKYGYRCANPHLLPSGDDARFMGGTPRDRRDRLGDRPFTIGPPAHPGLAERMPPNGFVEDLSTSPIHFDPIPHTQPGGYNVYGGMPYRSPNNDSRQPISPPVRALDATIPPTFNSYPVFKDDWPASMPSRGFGIGPSSATTTAATTAAFSNLGYMARPQPRDHAGERSAELASSPPNAVGKPIQNPILHSDRLRQHTSLASSLPMSRPRMHRHHDVSTDESDGDESFDLLPGNLDMDILTAAERKRRASRSQEDAPYRTGLHSNPDSKYGSPNAHSPPAWGPLSARKHREDNQAREVLGSSPHGPIGSPLRNASLHPDAAARGGAIEKDSANSPSIRPIPRPPSDDLKGDVSGFGFGMQSSPPGRRSSSGIGMLSHQLKNARLRDTLGATDLQAHMHRSTSNSSGLSNSPRTGPVNGQSSRLASGASMGLSDRVDEDSDIFAMDSGDESERSSHGMRTGARPAQGWGAADTWNRRAHDGSFAR